MKTTLGNPLIKVAVPYIFQLQYDEAGKEAVKKVLSDYKGTAAALNTFDVNEKGPVKGSNIYSRFVLGNVYRELTNADVRPINPKESEIALADNTLTDPTTTYEDLGVIVYPKKGVNEKIWKYLREQTKANFQDVDLRRPFITAGLMNPIKNDKYENGLRLDFNELTQVYNVPILKKETGNFDSNDPELQRIGFPGKLGKGNRTLYIANTGVRRLYRDRDLYLDASDGDLADSLGTGRAHFVENFSTVNLDKLISNLEQEKLKQEKSLKDRFDKAMSLLKNQ